MADSATLQTPDCPQELTYSHNRLEIILVNGNLFFLSLAVYFALALLPADIRPWRLLIATGVSLAILPLRIHYRRRWKNLHDRWVEYARRYEYPVKWKVSAQALASDDGIKLRIGVNLRFERSARTEAMFLDATYVAWQSEGQTTSVRFNGAQYVKKGPATAELELGHTAVITTPCIPSITTINDKQQTVGLSVPIEP